MKLKLADLAVDTFPVLPGDPETGADGWPAEPTPTGWGATCATDRVCCL